MEHFLEEGMFWILYMLSPNGLGIIFVRAHGHIIIMQVPLSNCQCDKDLDNTDATSFPTGNELTLSLLERTIGRKGWWSLNEMLAAKRDRHFYCSTDVCMFFDTRYVIKMSILKSRMIAEISK